ncbi:hypothetical protein AAL_07896 [Moelleriella libera RCEF 2490]|uniref:Glycosyltransferase family 31 protein n=1 Tax=Moelleriella libera RCEF 2490 TaxID=1081109 RepID=A0A162I5Q4_9HYPO|nr:hypothetical protein AAL_07896 [Moelleriella libera RCEF 2490]
MGVAIRPFKVSVRRRTPTVVIICSLSLLLLAFGAFERSESRLQYPLPLILEAALPERLRVPPSCRSDLNYLRRPEYGLSKEIIYQKRCVHGLKNTGVSRDNIAQQPRPLFQANNSRILDLNHGCSGALPEETACSPITLNVPLPYPKREYPELIFGVASSSQRLKDSIPQFRHWLGGTKARLLAIVTDHKLSNRQMRKLTTQFNQSGIHFIGVRPENPDIGVNEQHFVAVRDLLRHADEETKWGVIIDDDTFFPSLYPLAQALDKQDASVPAYVGALSENQEAVDFHGYMAYGGGGIFLSVPMLKLLEQNVDACLSESRNREGDGMLKYCVDTKTDANLTQIPGLHQLDFGGDLGGFYESGKLPLSLHHWKTWHQAPVDKMAKVGQFCGGCLFQRWRFGTDTVLANGYSIAVYKNGTAAVDLNRMEGTFRDSGPHWEWSLGPMRDALPADEKKSYVLADAEVVGDHLRQVYVYKAPGDEGRRDEVFELWWDWR